VTALYAIERGVPLPPREPNEFPFAGMDVGDSFLVTDSDSFASARAAASQYARIHGVKFTARAVADGLRVWRTA
jgi:hypothetical protein